MSAAVRYKEKFVAFVDIMGFEALVRSSEKDPLAANEIVDLQRALRGQDNALHIEEQGPIICPCAQRLEKGLDFQVTQASDSLLVSAEISPAGIINLLNHCRMAALRLLEKGHMCRGYVKRGTIHHDRESFSGSGFMDALQKEKTVSAFKRDEEDTGTPFVEIDPEVASYVRDHGDECVKTMFGRMTKSDGTMTALFPFHQFGHSFLIASPGYWFDPIKERENVATVRQWISTFKDGIAKHVNPADKKAVRKSEHYLTALDEQLKRCDTTDEIINQLGPIATQKDCPLNPGRWKVGPRPTRT